MNSNNPIHAILDALAVQQQRGETSLIVRLEPDLIPDAMNSLQAYRKLFAPLIPGLADTEAIYASYEVMRQADATKLSILLLVECQSLREFRDAIGRMPVRHSCEWRSFSETESAGPC